MRYIKFLFVTLAMLLVWNGKAAADDKCEPEMFMFGYAFSFNDSTLYLTAVQKVNNVWVRPRNGHVIERETYSRQLESYFEKDGVKDMTCGISFDTKEKNTIKKFNKLKERYANKVKHMRVICLTEADFAFTAIVPMQIDTKDNSEAMEKQKNKKADKKQSRRDKKKNSKNK